MRIPDYHIHTNYSPDSSMEPEVAVETAINAGITHMCFTEHMDLGHPMEEFNKVPDFEAMQRKIQELKENYPQIWIGHGLELGYMAESVEQSMEVLAGHSFEYVLLSVHCVDGLDCYFPEATRGRDKQTMYQRYLETVLESVKDKRLLDFYNCVGHIGYISKCRHYEENSLTYEMFPELLDEILRTIIQNGKGIEVNTSGIDKVGHVLPHPSIINRYRELGGNIITIGSDAHTPERVGKYIPDTIKLVRECGFEEAGLRSL